MVYVPFLAGQLLTAELLNERLVEETMAWTAIDDIGNFATNYSAHANTPMLRKIRLLGQERWEYKGRISIVAGSLTANVDHTIFTFDPGYRPTAEHGWSVCSASSDFFPVRLTLQVAGTLKAGVPTEAGNNANAILLDGMYIDAPI